MNDYAVLLYFDEQTQKSLSDLINVAADACGNRNMLEPSIIPPHITICYFTADNPDTAIILINEKTKKMDAGRIILPALGAFPPTVLYAAPILNEFLLRLCSELNALLGSKVKLADYYRPYNWMPHTTLATNLTLQQFTQSFISISEKFKPMMGTAAALSLAFCDPFTELKTWELADAQKELQA